MKSNHPGYDVSLLPTGRNRTERNQRSIRSNRRTDLLVGAAETTVIAGIFATLRFAKSFLEEKGKYGLFPAAGAFNFIRTLVALNQMFLENWENGTKERAVVEVISSAAVGTAVIGGLAEFSYAEFAPHIFTAMLAFKALYHFSTSAYRYVNMSLLINLSALNPDNFEEYGASIRGNFIASATLAASAFATYFAMVEKKEEIYCETGFAATFIATAIQLHGAYKIHQSISPPIQIELIDDADEEAESKEEEALLNSVSTGTGAGYAPPRLQIEDGAAPIAQPIPIRAGNSVSILTGLQTPPGAGRHTISIAAENSNSSPSRSVPERSSPNLSGVAYALMVNETDNEANHTRARTPNGRSSV